MQGTIITFYSFKGGVGRTMALANVAALLAREKKVLIVDFDLEALGLERYCAPFTVGKHETGGMLDIIESLAAGGAEALRWKKRVRKVRFPKVSTLDFLASGENCEGYSERVQRLDWNAFFSGERGGPGLEALREEWMAAYDFILIDSRTGYSDIGGICTILLPDVLAFVFASNDQSLSGGVAAVRRAQAARQRLAVDRMPLTVLPIPGRIEAKEARGQRQDWQERFVKALRPFFEVWLSKDTSITRVLEEITVPYFPAYSFGEEMPVLHESLTAPGNPARAYATITRILEQDFKNIESIIASQPVTAAIERHEGEINERQRAILEHVGRTGSVTSGWCRTTFGVTYDTANRDLNGMVEIGLLKRTGAGRSTAYRSPEKSPETRKRKKDEG